MLMQGVQAKNTGKVIVIKCLAYIYIFVVIVVVNLIITIHHGDPNDDKKHSDAVTGNFYVYIGHDNEHKRQIQAHLENDSSRESKNATAKHILFAYYLNCRYIKVYDFIGLKVTNNRNTWYTSLYPHHY